MKKASLKTINPKKTKQKKSIKIMKMKIKRKIREEVVEKKKRQQQKSDKKK